MNNLENVTDYPDGFYLIDNPREPEKSLVYLYTPSGFSDGRNEPQTTRHIAFTIPDGGGCIPIWDVSNDSVLYPVQIVKSSSPTTNEDLNQL